MVLALGAIGWDAVLRTFGPPRPWPRFGHAAEAALPDGVTLLGCYHPSQQNTFTGRLTPEMIDRVLERARAIGGAEGQTAQR